MRTPDLNWIKDPRVFQVNRLHAYSDHIYTIGKEQKTKLILTKWNMEIQPFKKL